LEKAIGSFILLERQKLVTTNVELVSGLEALCLDPFLGLYGEVHAVDGAKDFVDFANWRLILVLALGSQLCATMQVERMRTLFSR
jgi:hypothetical protein